MLTIVKPTEMWFAVSTLAETTCDDVVECL